MTALCLRLVSAASTWNKTSVIAGLQTADLPNVYTAYKYYINVIIKATITLLLEHHILYIVCVFEVKHYSLFSSVQPWAFCIMYAVTQNMFLTANRTSETHGNW